MFGTTKITTDDRRRANAARKSRRGRKKLDLWVDLWKGSESAPMYRVIGEKYVVLNVPAEPLQPGFVPAHKLRQHLEETKRREANQRVVQERALEVAGS